MDTIGHYQLRNRLGSGGFATVWLGYDAGFDGHVAIKVLGDNWVGNADVVRRFLDEARLLWRSEDDRVVDVFTIGELPSGQPWFAMEYADRGTLDERLTSLELTTDDALGLITEMANCTAAVHRLGAVHRDIKPGNFLIRSMSQGVSQPTPGLALDERLKISDLGFAKVLANSSGFTVPGGSPMYMAPEQASVSANVTFATDVFALGICAYEILSGAPPAARESFGVAAGFDAASLVPLTDVRADLSPQHHHAIMQALASDPAHRWPSAQAFADALTQATAATSLTPAMQPPQPPSTSETVAAATTSLTPAPQPPSTSETVAAATTSLTPAPLPPAAATPSDGRRIMAIGGAILAACVALAVVLFTTGDDPLAEAPAWFELPAVLEDEDVTVTVNDGQVALVAALPQGFRAACNDFVTSAQAANYQVIRNDCSAPEAVASLTNSAGSTAVIAQLDDGRVGWRFADG